MELKPKYQYTYFIKPFIIEKDNYKNYLTKMTNNKNISIKIWEKELDLDIYNYFLPEIRRQLFFGFEYSKDKIEEFRALEQKKQIEWLSKETCVQFNYNLNEDTPGKIGEENGIFFGINKIEIICFNTGECFLLIKTCVELKNSFSDILDFNYKFREFGSNFASLKEFEKISIQTNAFSTGEELKCLIEDLTCTKEKHEDLEDDNYYVYSYTCIDGESWNDKNTFEDIKMEFWKYANIVPSNYNIDTDIGIDLERIDKWKYARFGVNKNAAVLLSSSLNSYNYTKLPFEFENQYLYTYLLALYQKICFKKLINGFKNKRNIENSRKELNSFIQKMWMKEITKNETGASLYDECRRILDLENIYLETINTYDFAWKERKITTGLKFNKTIWIIIGLSLLMNIVNTIILINILR